jgi:two-component system chemotaxis response regulator CheB
MQKVRVLIVEDSLVVRQLLQHIISSDPRLEVAAAVGSAEEALASLERLSPDVISMDVRLPGMNGLQATQQIMARKPTPVVIVSASIEAEDLKISLNALRAGALAVIEKPVGISHADYARLAERLCTQLVLMSQVKVVRQRLGRDLLLPRAVRPAAARVQPGPFRLMGIVTSTGGPAALAEVLGGLPPDFPLPILLVQHISATFLEGFVSWLADVAGRPVKLAEEGELARAGTVYLPPADRHLEAVGTRLRLTHAEPVCLQRPSGTVLFQSLARSLGSAALGVLLTGMGEDGAEGLRALREAGGYTIAEDASTTVVYGMPAAAVRLGAVCESLPLPQIAPRLIELVEQAGPKSMTYRPS